MPQTDQTRNNQTDNTEKKDHAPMAGQQGKVPASQGQSHTDEEVSVRDAMKTYRRMRIQRGQASRQHAKQTEHIRRVEGGNRQT